MKKIIVGKLLVIWIFFNFIIGIYEIAGWYYNNHLYLEDTIWWNNLVECKSSNYLIDSWSEYSKVDTRYVNKKYVWIFEIINFITALYLVIILLNYAFNTNTTNRYDNINIITIKWIILIQLLNCVGYFASLFYEFLVDRVNITRYAKWWMYLLYYGISSIWIIIPSYLLLIM